MWQDFQLEYFGHDPHDPLDFGGCRLKDVPLQFEQTACERVTGTTCSVQASPYEFHPFQLASSLAPTDILLFLKYRNAIFNKSWNVNRGSPWKFPLLKTWLPYQPRLDYEKPFLAEVGLRFCLNSIFLLSLPDFCFFPLPPSRKSLPCPVQTFMIAEIKLKRCFTTLMCPFCNLLAELAGSLTTKFLQLPHK